MSEYTSYIQRINIQQIKRREEWSGIRFSKHISESVVHVIRPFGYLQGTPPLARDLRQNRSAAKRADCVYPAIFRFEYDNNRKTRQDISDGADGRICAPNAK